MEYQEAKPPFITEVKIKGLFGRKNIDWPLKQVNVLVGKNGSGKSTILKVIKNALTDKDEDRINHRSGNPSDIFYSISELDMSLEGGFSVCVKTARNSFSDLFSALGPKGLSEIISNLKITMADDKSDIKDEVRENLVRFIKDFEHSSDFKNGYFDENKNNAKQRRIVSRHITGPSKSNEKNDYFLDGMNVEYLSTFDMILLSKKEYDQMTGKYFTQLDVEVNREIAKLTKMQLELTNQARRNVGNKKKIKTEVLDKSTESLLHKVYTFESVLNSLFNSNGKMFSVKEDGGISIYHGSEEIDVSDLSSGEKQLILILLKVINSSGKPTIFLLDEPEISLHLDWQEKLINSILKINEKCQLIIVTHSPGVLMNGWLDKKTDIEKISSDMEV